MSYPRNAASPERVDIGPVVQISDGAVQTAGVAVKVIPFGGSEASGVGTVAYSADGVVLYTPTQAETNYTSFVLVASKTGCIPASKTVVTSAASVAGRTAPSDGSITAAVLATDAVAKIADGVWDEATAGHTTAGTYGGRVVRSMNSNVEVQITGSHHIAADVHEFQTGVIVAGAFAANAITAAALAADAVTEIQSGLATSAAVAAAKAILDKVDSGLIIDGAVYQFSANMLELGPSGGGGATLAKQEEILAAIQGSEVIQVASPNVLGNLVLTQGDSYDGIANPKAQWTVTTDYTDGWTVTLTIRDEDDAVIYTTAGTVVSPTVIAVAIASPTGLTMAGCPGQWQGKFDVQLTKAGSKKTIALGTCYINEDQTR